MRALRPQLLLLLGLPWWLLFMAAPGAGQPKGPLRCSIECSSYSSWIAEKRIRSYRLTEHLCSQQAVIFNTLKFKEICADPEADWVKKIVEKLDQKKAAASSLPHEVTKAMAPEDPAVFQKHVGHPVMAPSQASAPSGFFLGTVRSPPVTQDTSQHHAEFSPVTQEAAHSQVTPEANRDSLKPPEPSPTFAAGMVSSQPTPHPTDPLHGFHSAAGYTEEHLGHNTSAVADVQGMTSSSNSGPMSLAEGSDYPQPNKSLEHARAKAPDPVSGTFSSDLPSILSTTVPATPVPPEITSVSARNSTTAADKGPSVHISKVGSSSADAFGTRTFYSSSPAGKEEPLGPSAFPGKGYPDQAGLQMTTERPNILPPPSSSSASPTHVFSLEYVFVVIVCSALLYVCF